MRYRLLWLAVLTALFNSACSLLPGQAQPTPVPTAPTVATTPPSPVPPKPSAAPSPSPVAKPTATPEPELTTVWVGNTDSQGVFLRRTPSMADRLRAYPDRTPLTIIDVDVDAEGMQWHHVRAPDGQEGYVPVTFTVTTEP